MNGSFFPPADWARFGESGGAIAFLHDQALVQFNHRIWAYGLLIGGTIYAIQAWRWRLAEGLGVAAFAVAGALWLQALLGVVTLVHAVPLWLGALHQAGAALVLATATVNLWLVRHSQARLFVSGPRSGVF
jgi:cytochrome c oxidase assembly protein subunit 15